MFVCWLFVYINIIYMLKYWVVMLTYKEVIGVERFHRVIAVEIYECLVAVLALLSLAGSQINLTNYK